jgi:type IV secretion system protein VirD4
LQTSSGPTSRVDEFKPDNTHGGAKFAETKDLRKAGLFKGNGIPIGYDGHRELHYPGAAHLLTIAPTRGGINALLSWRHSCVVIDPKAENACVTAHFRKRFGKVWVLNPFHIWPDKLSGLKYACFNPMSVLDCASPAFHAMCEKIAAVLIVEDEHSEGRHWTAAARILVSGIIAALARHADADRRNLVEVLSILSGGDELFRFCREAMQSKDPDIIRKLQRFALPEDKEPSREMVDVVSTAITQLGFITGAIAESLRGPGDFRFADLKRNPGTTVYVCLPLDTLDVTDKYFRLVVDCFLADLLGEGRRGKSKPVLTIIDEMFQLGPHMKSLANAMGMAAGAAPIQIWGVLQDLSQLQGMFPKTWESFIQNSVSMWLAARDATTREYVSKLAGTCEVVTRSRNANLDRQTGEVVVSESGSQFGRPLLHPHEVGALAKDEMLVFGVEGVNGPIRAKRKPYWKVGKFAGKFRKNPYVNSNGGGLFGRLFG